ncbi:hypothetical protein [Brachybacterium saurashtrense]|uniref:Uncharacterized protein n=1 Tax=Brachybacterium saurashtrense TaxID=556288 RepID=A0A345YSJ4_9MICO|nr:hypothetical protein [Brachybacterium saurashtrense]AXK46896.1 hypothetical protein DWV08_15575 [Brachybacterium saurashtrense]RRR22611.1 hypothetical protein DXU92_10195 [Brachybacterium saurashtrense]
MRTLRTLVIVVAAGLAAIALAVLPAADESPQARPGISVGATPVADGTDAAGEDAASQDAAPPSPASQTAAENGSSLEAVQLPQATATAQPGGVHSDGAGMGAVEPSPTPAPTTAAPRPSSSSSQSSSSGGSSSGSSQSAPDRPSGVCEWDDGELECDDDDDADDDDDDDD